MAVPVYWGLLWLTLCSSIAIIQAALDALAKLQRQGAFPPITVDEPPGPGANPKSNALPSSAIALEHRVSFLSLSSMLCELTQGIPSS
jgi:hypothetical protein